MAEELGPAYVGATIVAAVAGTVGVWLPWYTLTVWEGGMVCYQYGGRTSAGLQGYDPLAVAIFAAIASGVLIAYIRGRRPDFILLGVGAIMFLMYLNTVNNYWGDTCYTARPGIYLVLLSTLLLALIGAAGILTRRGAADGTDRPEA